MEPPSIGIMLLFVQYFLFIDIINKRLSLIDKITQEIGENLILAESWKFKSISTSLTFKSTIKKHQETIQFLQIIYGKLFKATLKLNSSFGCSINFIIIHAFFGQTIRIYWILESLSQWDFNKTVSYIHIFVMTTYFMVLAYLCETSRKIVSVKNCFSLSNFLNSISR